MQYHSSLPDARREGVARIVSNPLFQPEDREFELSKKQNEPSGGLQK